MLKHYLLTIPFSVGLLWANFSLAADQVESPPPVVLIHHYEKGVTFENKTQINLSFRMVDSACIDGREEFSGELSPGASLRRVMHENDSGLCYIRSSNFNVHIYALIPGRGEQHIGTFYGSMSGGDFSSADTKARVKGYALSNKDEGGEYTVEIKTGDKAVIEPVQ